MKRLVILAAALVAAASWTAAHADDTDKVGESPYYPLKIGTTWTYTAPMNKTIVAKVVAHEKKGGVMCAKIESSADGQVQGTEHIGITKDGIYRYTLNGKDADKPILILKLHDGAPKADDEWKIDAKIGSDEVSGTMRTADEKISVPAGKYDAISAGGKLEAGNQSVTATSFFVKDVGVAKIKMVINNQTIDVELTKFEPGK